MAMDVKQKKQAPKAKEKSVVKCDFGSASRISNETARALTSIHEGFARNLASALDSLIGTGLEVKLSGLDQLCYQEHIASIPPHSCVVALSTPPLSGSILLECDIELVLPLIDLLLGGNGSQVSEPREISEIEEEIMQDIFSLIARHAEVAWGLIDGALVAGERVRPAMLDGLSSPAERVTCLKFSLEIGAVAGRFQIVIPPSMLDRLLQQSKPDQPRKRPAVRYFPRQGIRDRILDSDVEVAVELPSLKIAVKDLLALLPGSVVKLRASVRTPGMLVAGGHGIFEANPVRNGARKAAQLGRRIASAHLEEV